MKNTEIAWSVCAQMMMRAIETISRFCVLFFRCFELKLLSECVFTQKNEEKNALNCRATLMRL